MSPLSQLGIFKYFVGQPYGKEISMIGQGMILTTLASYDASVATFVMLQAPLVGKTLQLLGSEDQKQRFLSELVSGEKVWGWGLTEQNIGSDAAHLQTTVEQNSQGFILKGNKKWIGNGNRDFLIVYARNQNKGAIQGYIVDMRSEGVQWTKIQDKLPLRMVENCKITFNDVKLNAESQLPEATNFQSGVAAILRHSRISVIWITLGVALRVYESSTRYALASKQLQAAQLIQQKIVKMMANIQAMILLSWRITKLYQQKQMTMGNVSMCKAYLTESTRLICQLGISLMGKNALLHNCYPMKALCDLEALYTYEGTYDINTLIAGSEITGIKAIH